MAHNSARIGRARPRLVKHLKSNALILPMLYFFLRLSNREKDAGRIFGLHFRFTLTVSSHVVIFVTKEALSGRRTKDETSRSSFSTFSHFSRYFSSTHFRFLHTVNVCLLPAFHCEGKV